MTRCFTSFAIVSLGLALATASAGARAPQRGTSAELSAKPVVLRLGASKAPRTAAPAARALPAPARTDIDHDGERFRYDSCGCSGG